MAILSFENSFNPSVTDPDPLSSAPGGNVIRLTGPFNSIDRFVVLQQVGGVGFRAWFAPDGASAPSLPASSSIPVLIRFFDADFNTHVCLAVTSTGALQVFLGTQASGTLLAETGPGIIKARSYQHIEMKVRVANAPVGTVDVLIDGRSIISLAGIDTQFGILPDLASMRISSTESAGTNARANIFIKDLVFYDGLGTVNNDLIGTNVIKSYLPVSDSSLNWTPSTGSTGFNLIDNVPPIDTEFVSAPTPPPSPYLFNLAAPPSTVTSVRAVIAQSRPFKSDSDTATVQVGLKSGATTGLGEDRTMSTSPAFVYDIFEIDPNTSAAWTPANAAAVQMQINRTA